MAGAAGVGWSGDDNAWRDHTTRKREKKEYGRGETKIREVKRNSLSPMACLTTDRYRLISDDPRKPLVLIWALMTARCTSVVLSMEARTVRGLGPDGP